MGGGGMGGGQAGGDGGRREEDYTYRYTVTTSMTLQDESHFNGSVIVRGKVTKTAVRVHKPQLFKREESRSGIEPRSLSACHAA